MFRARGPNDVVFYTGGSMISRTISDGDRVSLRSGDETVLVRDVSVDGPGRFSGDIYGFEPSHATEVNGLRIGERVQFENRHVFGVDGN